MLSIIQRCPRYLILLKDLIGCTSADDPEHAPLVTAHTLVSKSMFHSLFRMMISDPPPVTSSLNTSLHTRAQTLSLLAIQHSTPNLPFQLISPGRTLLKRGSLLQVEASSRQEREFFLFSDCLLWLLDAEKASSGELTAEKWSRSFSPPTRPPMIRNRSKNDADISMSANNRPSSTFPSSKSHLPLKGEPRYPSSNAEEKWIYGGHIDLADIEVVVTPASGTNQDHRLEILSPHSSFALCARECRSCYPPPPPRGTILTPATASNEERDAWVEGIRSAKLTAMDTNSTFTSSTPTNHLRRTLQALPHLPQDDHKSTPRRKVEHFVPAIWIPDGKIDTCMRCGRPFRWRRRRHHCRLCGRCVCGGCSEKVRSNTRPTPWTDWFLARPFTSPKVRKMETNIRPLGLVNSATKQRFLS